MPRRQASNQRHYRVPGNVDSNERVWFETWLIPIENSFRIKAFKVTVYDDGGPCGWTGYKNDPDTGEIYKNHLISIWPKWAWKMVIGPTSDVVGTPAPWHEKALTDGPVQRWSSLQSAHEPDKEDEAQRRIADFNWRETVRARERAKQAEPPEPAETASPRKTTFDTF